MVLSYFRFVFPAILIPYIAIPSVALGKHCMTWNYHLNACFSIIALITLSSSFLDREKLFCSSQYFIEAVTKPTMYCSITGKHIIIIIA